MHKAAPSSLCTVGDAEGRGELCSARDRPRRVARRVGRGSLLFVATLWGGCAAPPASSTPAPAESGVAAAAQPATRTAKAPAAPYAPGLRRAFLRARRAKALRETGKLLVARRLGAKPATFLMTIGIGEVPRAAPSLPEDLRRVELIAICEEDRPEVAEILAALSPQVVSSALKPYDTASLEEPLYGLQHFDLLPGGELSVPGRGLVRLLRVVPVGQTELEERGADNSQWVGSYAADPGGSRPGARWTELLPKKAP